MTTTKRTLPEHIGQALHDTAQRILEANPDPRIRDSLANWIETAHERITIVPTVDRRKNGRIDTRSYALQVWLTTDHGPAPLCTILNRPGSPGGLVGYATSGMGAAVVACR